MTAITCNRTRVAYLGPPGTYTHQATCKIFSPNIYCIDAAELIPDVFNLVASGTAHYGVVPISNSTKGVVHATLASFMKLDCLFDNVRICGEVFVRVNHCLLGLKPSAASAAQTKPSTRRTSVSAAFDMRAAALGGKLSTSPPKDTVVAIGNGAASASGGNSVKPRSAPLYSLKHIKKVYSHEQALQQCTVFLDHYLPNAERVEVSSTSRAAEIAFEDKTGASAGISSVMASDVYGIDILARDIQNAAVNATAFLILRKISPGDDISRIPKDIPHHPEATKWKGYMSFTVPAEKPEQFGRVLAKLMEGGVSVTNVHSEPRDGHPFEFDYFVTIETNPPKKLGNREFEKLIKETEGMCQTFKWFGYWPKLDWKENC